MPFRPVGMAFLSGAPGRSHQEKSGMITQAAQGCSPVPKRRRGEIELRAALTNLAEGGIPPRR